MVRLKVTEIETPDFIWKNTVWYFYTKSNKKIEFAVIDNLKIIKVQLSSPLNSHQ